MTFEIGAGSVFDIPPGHDGWVIGDEPWETFDVAGMRQFGRPIDADDRVLATIMFTDIVDSTAAAARMGDVRWNATMAQINERCQLEVDRLRGRLVKTTGDGVLAVFDNSERAVRCARTAVEFAPELGLAMRAGVHTGEVELGSTDARGIAVHVASRIMTLAGPGEVLVSGTTRDLLVDSPIEFEDRGEHELKGVTGARRIFAIR